MTDDKTRPLLEINDLAVHFPVKGKLFAAPRQLKAVDGVDLTLNEGECLGIVGESGCGKTTLSNAVMGLQPTTRGKITLAGEPVQMLESAGRAARASQVQMGVPGPIFIPQPT